MVHCSAVRNEHTTKTNENTATSQQNYRTVRAHTVRANGEEEKRERDRKKKQQTQIVCVENNKCYGLWAKVEQQQKNYKISFCVN